MYDEYTVNLLKKYRKFKEFLTVNVEHDIILKEHKIVLPAIFHRIVIKLGHIGHQGVQKTKALVRSKVFFLGMDKAIEEEVKNCIACQASTRHVPPAQIKPTEISKEVWDTLNVDYLGPLPNGRYVFAIMDQRSRFPVVAITSSTSAKCLIKSFHAIFGQYGYPKKVISDNGPPFKSKEIRDYFKQNAIIHHRITPYWPQANGEIERFMIPMMKVIQSAYVEQRDWENCLHEFLLAYRTTPHSSTNIPPADLMFKRKIRQSIPNITNKVNDEKNQTVLTQNDLLSKQKALDYTNKKRRPKETSLNIGDRVLIKQPRQNKLSTPFKPFPYRVIARKGTMITARNISGEHEVTRNQSHFKHIPETAIVPKHEKIELELEEGSVLGGAGGVVECESEDPGPDRLITDGDPQRKTYPQRVRRPIDEWRKY